MMLVSDVADVARVVTGQPNVRNPAKLMPTQSRLIFKDQDLLRSSTHLQEANTPEVEADSKALGSPSKLRGR
jgi:hypothetical protein